jgi:CRISPR-associated protein Cas1
MHHAKGTAPSALDDPSSASARSSPALHAKSTAPSALDDRPKVLKRSLPSAPPDLVPARMVNAVLYCERLLYLEWAQGEFEDNVFTVHGKIVHRRADAGGGEVPAAEAESDEKEPPPFTARAVWLSSERLGLTAKIDVVEGENGVVVPVEYKRGRAPEGVPGGAYLPDRAQVCVHVLLLREHGHRCEHGEIYFAGDKRRVTIEIDDWLIERTLAAAARAREIAAAGIIPDPLENSPKCKGCSLAPVCLPDEVTLLRALEGRPLDVELNPDPQLAFGFANDVARPTETDPWALGGDTAGETAPAKAIRRLVPPRDAGMPVYVQTPGARVSLDGERLRIEAPGAEPVEARIAHTSQLVLMGNVQITTQALAALFDHDIPVAFFSGGGWFRGRTVGHASKNIELRVAQFAAAADPALALRLARTFVAAKIRNQRTLLRRNHEAPDPVVLNELEMLAKKAEACDTLTSLLGLEGTAARFYFGAFSGMLKGGATGFDFAGRNRRPPRDPVNALLSMAYSLLTKDCVLAVAATGMDPLLGFLHQPRYGRPALALDLMEEMRPLIADSVVVTALNTQVVDADDFVRAATGCSLKPAGRRKFIEVYERRMDQLVTHPLFGYRISYRTLLQVQARLLSRVLLGEIAEYPAFRTR